MSFDKLWDSCKSGLDYDFETTFGHDHGGETIIAFADKDKFVDAFLAEMKKAVLDAMIPFVEG